MNDKAVMEIGRLIHAYRTFNFKDGFRKMTPKEVTKTFEYKQFKICFPELCKLAEKGDINKRNKV